MIILHPKSGDTNLISNWRPISLMTCDYKILTKIFANRLKNILSGIISEEQFCCPRKTIVDHDMIMRDVIYYTNENNVQGAVLSLDWSKAYDRVDHDFLYAAMSKLGFSESFIQIIKLFSSNMKSVLQINGILSDTFDIGRGIRQGCPLSMILYVLFKEALYCNIKSNISIKGPRLPNDKCLKILGYADDTTLFLKDNLSILEIMRVINKFEKATGAILNKDKTKIYGMGTWNNKLEWPVPWLQNTVPSFNSLGIIYSNDYNLSVNLNWESVLSAIESKTTCMQNIQLTIYQRAVLLNCIIYSKLWYVSHVFPLPIVYANKIKKVSFNYLWAEATMNPLKDLH